MNKKLLLLQIPFVIAVLTMVIHDSFDTYEPSTDITDSVLESMKNMRLFIDKKGITLVDGLYQERISPDSDTLSMNVRLLEEFMVRGDFDSDYYPDVVLTLENNPSNKNAIYYLALVFGNVNFHTISLGDQITLKSLVVKDNIIEVSYLPHDSENPLAPSNDNPITKQYQVIGGKLIPVDEVS